MVRACARGIRLAACASQLYRVFILTVQNVTDRTEFAAIPAFFFVVGMDTNTWKQVGMERTTTNSLVPFQPFQLGRMKLRHTLRVFAEDQRMLGFGPTGYSDYQNRIGFETACEKPNNYICFEVEVKFQEVGNTNKSTASMRVEEINNAE